MCGFCCVFNIDGVPVDTDLLQEMTGVISHRGPDDEGYLLINENNSRTVSCYGDDTVSNVREKLSPCQNTISANIGFGFRRLAIIDLSDHGHQPMTDHGEDISIVFNGEIYNYLELRQELKLNGYVFTSSSDTEVILKAYRQWGLDCVHHFNGMWAFAIWDNRRKRLFCSRDRFGIKPFYYHYQEGKQLIIASEIKSILKLLKPSADFFSINEFLAWGQFDHTEHTFFNQVRQLRGAHQLLFQNGRLNLRRYYDLKPCSVADDRLEIIEQFRQVFLDSVKIRLRSDVPVGFALSGGLDSSSIVSNAKQLHGTQKLHTFSVIFPGTSKDESFFVKEITDYTGVLNRSISPDVDDLLSEMNRFTWHQEEPNNGSSYLAAFLLRKFIRQHDITVTLEGQGADEIISGYRPLIHFYLQDLLREKKVIKFFREIKLLRDITKIQPQHIAANFIAVLCPGIYKYLRRFQLRRLSDFLIPQFVDSFSQQSVDYPLKERYSSHLNQKLYQFLFHTSIPPQLVRADKSSMAFSQECRFPFLDYRLVELAFSLPYDFKIKDGVTKYVLREAMKPNLPEAVYNRRDKLGFPTPEDEWLRGSLRPWVSDCIYSSDFRSMPFLHWQMFEKKFQNFLKYGGGFGPSLWSVLSIYNWKKSFNVCFDTDKIT